MSCNSHQGIDSYDLSRPHSPNTVIIQTSPCRTKFCTQELQNRFIGIPAKIISAQAALQLGQDSLITLEVNVDSSALSETLNWLMQQNSVKFASPDFIYQTQKDDSGERTGTGFGQGNTSHLDSIHWQPMQAPHEDDQSMIIAVTDDGFDLDHIDLASAFFKNAGESGLDENGQDRSSNGVDDDNNGYIDDHSGWDFTGQEDNDPRPNEGDYHGTHIAGIIAASSNGIGAEGIAPGVKVLPIRFSGDGVWSSLRVARSYHYALKMGASIISSSYSIDQFVGDPVYRLILDHLHQEGVLVFNSAGNNMILNPARQAFEQLILVGNSYSKLSRRDEINQNSNYGVGIDIYAPGDVYSTLPNDRYGVRTGTSMATPVAAASAALIWQENPQWNRDQVIEQLFSTADSIAEQNPERLRYLGNGRVNLSRALEESGELAQISLLTEQVSQEHGELLISVKGLLNKNQINNKHFFIIDENGKSHDFNWLRKYHVGSNMLAIGLNGLEPGSYKLVIAKNLRTANNEIISKKTQRFSFNVIASSIELLGVYGIRSAKKIISNNETLALQIKANVDENLEIVKVEATFKDLITSSRTKLKGTVSREFHRLLAKFTSSSFSLVAGQYELELSLIHI